MNYTLKYLARRKGSKVAERKKGPLAGQKKSVCSGKIQRGFDMCRGNGQKKDSNCSLRPDYVLQ